MIAVTTQRLRRINPMLESGVAEFIQLVEPDFLAPGSYNPTQLTRLVVGYLPNLCEQLVVVGLCASP